MAAILFLDDWKLYPTATIHYETRNTSFLELSAKYREMGIKNHAFILALINPDLRHLDPQDTENLSYKDKLAIALECAINPWYYFREVARAPAKATPDPLPLLANRGNIALWWCFFCHIMVFLIQPRQTGKSLSTDELMVYLLGIACQYTEINLLTKDETLRKTNIDRIKEIFNFLPPYICQRTKKDSNNTESIEVKSLNNRYISHLPQSSPKAAFKIGRGLTSPIFHGDEVPFQSNVHISLPAALAATTAVSEIAKAAGKPHGVILTTTAGRRDQTEGKYCFELMSESAVWTEGFFDAKNLEELEEMVRRNSKSGVLRINATFSHRQLGKTDEWLKRALENSLQKGVTANQDFFNIWETGGEGNPLHVDLLKEIESSSTDPAHMSIDPIEKYIVRWYIDEDILDHYMASNQFTLGLDTSDAAGNDDIGLTITNTETLEVIGAANFNVTNLFSFSVWFCKFLVRYKNILANIERKSSGIAIIDYLLIMLPQEGEDPFKRLYNSIVNSADEDRERFNEILTPVSRRNPEIYTRYKKTFGFITSSGGIYSRAELYSTTLQNAAKKAASVIRDRMLVGQISGLVIKNGRIDHASGGHDDMVVSWLLSNWVLMHGKNLSFYNLDGRRIMSKITNVNKLTDAEIQFNAIQEVVRKRIDLLAEELSEESDDTISRLLERELRMLNQHLVLEAGEIHSVDELIRRAHDKKRLKNRSRAQEYSYASRFISNNSQVGQSGFSDMPVGGNSFSRY